MCRIHILENAADHSVINKVSNVAQLSIYIVGSEVLGPH